MDTKLLKEEESLISFSVEDVDFQLKEEKKTIDWIRHIVESEKQQLRLLTYIFCSDAYLHEINLQYLQHDTYTDIITFPYENPPLLHGDIFISIGRVRENAVHFEVPFEQELRRVMIHGVLHLCGYQDKTEEEAKIMRAKENASLVVWDKMH